MQLGDCDDDWIHRGDVWESVGACDAVLDGESEYEEGEEGEEVDWLGGEGRGRHCSRGGGCAHDCSTPGSCGNGLLVKNNGPPSTLGTVRWDEDLVERGEEEESKDGKRCSPQCDMLNARGGDTECPSRRVTRSMRSIGN